MLRYFIKLIFICLAVGSFAQELPERKVYIRPGVDLSRFVLPFINDIGVNGFELSLDTEIKYSYFPTIEFGMNSVNEENDMYKYEMQGSYWRVGMNYNMLKYQHRLDRNMFFIGIRYAQGKYWQQASNIVFENEYGESITDLPKTRLTQEWMEGVIGIRGEILDNFFLGYTIRIKAKLNNPSTNGITPYFIPGYGTGKKSVHAGISFTASYAIPLKKLDIDKAKKAKGNEDL